MKREVEGFVKWEMQMFRDECNFTPDESIFFDLRNGDEKLTLEEIAGQMGYSMSKVTDLVKDVNAKIIKVIPLRDAYFKKYCNEYR